MKKIFVACLLAVLATLCGAQATTAVSGTVTDSDGSLWYNATCSVVFVPSPTQPNPATYTNQGVPVTTPTCTYTANTAAFSFTAGQNTVIAPTGSMWQIVLCPLVTNSPCQNYTFIASGASLDLSSALTASLKAPRISAVPSMYGYTTAEVVNTITPGTIFNVIGSTSTTCQTYGLSSWGACGVTITSTYQIGSDSLGSNSTAGGSGSTRCWDFISPANFTGSKIVYRVGVADVSANLYDMGIYSFPGQLIAHTGPIAGTTAFPAANTLVTSNLTAPVTLLQGVRYAFCGTASTSVGQFQGNNYYSGMVNVQPSAGSGTVGGTLNNTVTLPADSFSGAIGARPQFWLRN